MFGALVSSEDAIAEFLSAALVVEESMERVLETGWRIASLRMAFNEREGAPATKFTVPKRMLGIPPLSSGPLAKVQVDIETQNREYLEAMGWDAESAAPTKETIEKLGLASIIK